MSRWIGYAALVIYGLGIFLANWMIRNVGVIVLPDGTHLLPVAPGIYAPSGVFAVGIVLVARDVVQRTIGRSWSLLVIIPGALFTALLDPRLAVASAAAFAFSEFADFAVFTPLQRRGLALAVFTSVAVASVVDSLIFLVLAGIPLEVALLGQLIGKWEMAILAIPVMWALRRWIVTPRTRPVEVAA